MDTFCAGREPGNGNFPDKGTSILQSPRYGDIESKILQQLSEVSASLGLVHQCQQSLLQQSLEKQLQQMKEQVFAKLDAVVTQTEYLQRLERSVNTLLDRSMKSTWQEGQQITSVPTSVLAPAMPEAKAKDNVGAQLDSLQTVLIEERAKDNSVDQLDPSQTVLIDELKTQKETLALFKAQQDQFLREFKEIYVQDHDLYSAMLQKIVPSKVGATDERSSKSMADAIISASPAPVAICSTVNEEEVENAGNEEKEEETLSETLEIGHLETEELDGEVDHHTLLLQEGSGLGDVFSVDNELERPVYHVENFFWETGTCQKIARSNSFANFTVGVVTFNAIYIGFDSDYNKAQNIYNADLIFLACSQFFCVYFTGELVVRILAFEHKRNIWKDGWFKFDAFLVSTMILDTWILMPTLFVVGGGVKIPTQPLRMLRLFKLTRMARLMKAFPELVTMIKGLMRSLRAISSSMILIGLMVYVWAIMMHMLMKEEQEYNESLWRDYELGFETMTTCIWSLLVAGTLMLDNAAPLMSSLLFSDHFNYVLAGFLFVSYAMMSAMCILQMLIGVLCDVVSTVKQEESSAAAIGLMKQELLKHLNACDDSGDGKISQSELARVMKKPRSRALLRKLRINYSFFLELVKGVYAKHNTPVPIKDVLELMVLSRGDNVATVESMSGALVTIINELVNVRTILGRDITSLETRLSHDIEELKAGERRTEFLEARLHDDIDRLEELGAKGGLAQPGPHERSV